MNQQTASSAGVARRLAAIFYDFLLLMGVVLSTAIIVPLILSISSGQASMQEGQTIHELEPIFSPIYLQLYMLVVIVIFYCWFWKKNGQTLGMQSWRLKLVNKNGGGVTLSQSLLRLAAASLSLACAGLGYWWIWLDKDGCSWHDRISGTRIQLLEKNK